MRKWLQAIFLGTILSLSSCDTLPKIHGGDVVYTKTTTTTVLDENKNPKVTVEKTDIVAHQPENAKTPAIINIDKGDTIRATTGESQDLSKIEKILASVGMLSPVIYAGIAMIIAGAGVFIFLKDAKWAIILGLVGGGMIAGAYLLVQYAMWFMLGVIALAIWGIYFLISHKKLQLANIENIGVVQALKKELPQEVQDKYFEGKDALVKTMQSKSTQTIVDNVKEKEFGK